MEGDGVEAERAVRVTRGDGGVENAVVGDAVGGEEGHVVDRIEERGVAQVHRKHLSLVPAAGRKQGTSITQEEPKVFIEGAVSIALSVAVSWCRHDAGAGTGTCVGGGEWCRDMWGLR